MELTRLLTVSDPTKQSELWKFYDKVFRPVNEETPISQSYPRRIFIDFLTNPQVVKFVAREGDQLVGLGFITTQLELEPLISLRYISKHYEGRPVFYVPVIAVDSTKRNSRIVLNLIKAMLDEIPENGVLIFFCAKTNTGMIKFAEIYGEGGIVDTELCCIYQWKQGARDRLLGVRAGSS